LRLSPNGFEKEVVPILVDALLGAAISEFKKDNFQGSIGFLKEGLALEPQSDRLKGELFQALLALGVKLLSEERSGEAIAAFSEAVKLFPTDYRAYLGLARAFLQNQDFHMAMKAIRHALTVDPANMEAQDLLQELLTQ
jgi:Flp pilus assembly protein TadD